MDQFKFWNLLPLHGNKIKIYALATVLLLCALQTNAQKTPNLPRHDKKLIHFGISLGTNSGKFKITHSEDFIHNDTIKVVDSPSSLGFNVGIVSDLHLTKNLDLRFIPTLMFAEKDLRYTEVLNLERDTSFVKTIESITLSFPLLLKYKSERIKNNFRIYILGGMRLDWDLASNSKARKATDIVKIDRIDTIVEYGFGMEFYFPLFIFSPEIKFGHGITNMHVPTNDLRFSDVLGKLKSKYITLSFQFEG